VVCNLDTGTLLAMQWKRSDQGHALWVVGADDGEHFKPLTDRPVFRDHDAFGLMWDPRSRQYIDYNATYQTHRKLYPDNAGANVRRVMHIRTSKNGIEWTPGDDVSLGGPHAPDDTLITPDDDDPAELEFYRFTAFPYADRYAGMMLLYAPSPQVANPRQPFALHGPHLAGEWWTSVDGFPWQRPYRDLFAPGQAPGIVDTPPMTLAGQHRWLLGDGNVYALPEDRLFFTGSLANAAFTTPVFTMPATPLALNAELNYHADPQRGMQGQGYVAAELLDEHGQIIDGYERDNCVIFRMDQPATLLHWAEKTGTALADRTVRLRLTLRDARIYALCSS
jgi:hypothetical protein